MFFDDPVAAFANLRRATADGRAPGVRGWQPVFANDWMLVPMGAMVEHLGMPDIVRAGRTRAVLAGRPRPGAGRARRTAGSPTSTLADEAHPCGSAPTSTTRSAYMGASRWPVIMFEGKPPDWSSPLPWRQCGPRSAPHVTDDGLSLPGKAWLVTARAA